ncbi:MAG TPA: gamma-glutamyl-gamma-aminobutyrate hydrolase family protein [Pirellulaceae bacterium]|jgi:putative glutamine amidotransferase|nr:gamma-glutamyl-gamma-aminobutyrate hydrolase family protein [Pirellulaceae bacterium]
MNPSITKRALIDDGNANRRHFLASVGTGLAAAGLPTTSCLAVDGDHAARRPVIAMDIKLRHLRATKAPKSNDEKAEFARSSGIVGPEQYETDFAYRDEYRIYNRYVDQIFESGGIPLLVPCFTDEPILKQYVDMADGFLFVGVNDYPPAFYREPKLIETQVKNTPGYKRLSESNMILARLVLQENKRMPVLGICAGPQLCTIALGGKLIQHVEGHIAHSNIRDREHKVTIRGGHIMKGLFGETAITVNSNHHQAADPDHMGKGLQAVAYAEDGVIEAIECTDPNRFVLGVQWHPERVRFDDHREKIFGGLIHAARKHRSGNASN